MITMIKKMTLKKFLLSSITIFITLSTTAYADGFPKLAQKKDIKTPIVITPTAAKPNHNPEPTEQVGLNKIVAVTNNDVISQMELNNQVNQAKSALEHANIPIPEQVTLEKQILNQLITQKLELDLANKNGITASDFEVDQALDQIALRNKMTLAQMKPSIINEYGSMSAYKKILLKEVIIRKMKQRAIASSNIQITHKEIQKFLDKQKQQQAQQVQYQVAHILIPLPTEPDAKNIKSTKEKSESIREKIVKGMSFTKAAASYSAAGDAMKGGVLPWKTLDELPDAFQSVSSMQMNQVSKLVRSPGGFNIIKLIGKRDQPAPKIFINKYHIQQIVINVSPVVTNLDAKARLLRIRDTLLHTKKSFAKLARSNSDDYNSSEKGGELDWVSSDQLNSTNPKMADIASELKTNEISKPFKSDNKWYLIKLIGKKKIDNTLDLQKQHAQQVLFQKKAMNALDTWESELRGSSYVKIVDPKLQ
jgi:peptidyl-prolyl cis-trans isomerase SurA